MSSYPSGLTVDISRISGRIKELYYPLLGFYTARINPSIQDCFLNRLASLYIYYSHIHPDFNDMMIFTNANSYLNLILTAVLFSPALDMRVPAAPSIEGFCPGTLVVPFGTQILESVESIMARVKPVADSIQRQMTLNSHRGAVSPMPEITQKEIDKAIYNVQKLLEADGRLEEECARAPRTLTARPRPEGGAGSSGYRGGRKKRTHKKRSTKRRITKHKRRHN
jgi:hypothetical protein